MAPQGFTRVRDIFLSSSTQPQVHPITKSQGMESSISSSGPTQNLGAVHLKIDAQISYDIQLGRSLTLWKDKGLMFLTGPVSYPTKI
jgi:hypothetical protein